MVYCIDNDIREGKYVRTLMYENASELTGSTITTENAGDVQCAVGSVAMKAGFKDPMQLSTNGTWVAG